MDEEEPTEEELSYEGEMERCYRDDFNGTDWQCVNGHTACLWNNGNDGCSHPGKSMRPLEHPEEDE